jgi:hypothetical protein
MRLFTFCPPSHSTFFSFSHELQREFAAEWNSASTAAMEAIFQKHSETSSMESRLELPAQPAKPQKGNINKLSRAPGSHMNSPLGTSAALF